MKTIAELKQERAALIADAKAIEATAAKEDRDLTEDESTNFDALMESVDTTTATIERREKLAKVEGLAGETPKRATPAASAQEVVHVRDRSEDDPMAGFGSPREFLVKVMEVGQGRRADQRLAPLQAAVGSDEQGEYSDPHGGFLLPKAMRPDILKLNPEADPTAGLTTKIPVTTASIDIPARVDKNHSSSVSGGLQFSWRAETEAGTSSRMSFEQISLKPHSATGLSYVTEELLADSPQSFAAIIEQGFRDEAPAFLFDAKINGTGTGQYEGILNSPALVSITKETGQAAATITYENIVKMWARCYGKSRAIWLANHDTIPQLASITDAGDNNVFHMNAAAGMPSTLFGRPLYFTEFTKTLGTKGDLVLADWSQYIEATREGMTMADSVHVRFVNHERAFRVVMRIDGRCWWRSALTPKNGTNTLSPFVTLNTRS